MRQPLIRPRRVVLKPRPRRGQDVVAEEPAERGAGLYFAAVNSRLRFIPTGCTLLDLVLGGGWPLGRVVNIVGDKSTGKTLLGMEAVANFFRLYPKGWCRYVEAEGAFEPEYAKALGIPIDRVDIRSDFDTVEQLFTDLETVKSSKNPGLYIVDSLDALSDEAELKRGIADATYGGSKAKKMSELFRRLARSINKKEFCVMIISQVRDAIGIAFGDRHTRSGGKALDFYASQVLWLAHIETLKRELHKFKRSTGIRIRARCKKNKVGLPFRECEFNIRFGYGIEDAEASAEWLREAGINAKVPSQELEETVRRKWYAVEKSFLPMKSKYG